MTDTQRKIIDYYLEQQESGVRPSIKQVASHAGCTPKYVPMTLKQFNKSGHIKVTKRKDKSAKKYKDVLKFFVKIVDKQI